MIKSRLDQVKKLCPKTNSELFVYNVVTLLTLPSSSCNSLEDNSDILALLLDTSFRSSFCEVWIFLNLLCEVPTSASSFNSLEDKSDILALLSVFSFRSSFCEVWTFSNFLSEVPSSASSFRTC